jgi:hypothetical protein
MKIAAITMVYNEPDFLPIWLRYYEKQVGLENCYVIDHGTDDGSTASYQDLAIIRLPRTPLDDAKSAGLVSSVVSFLLSTYDVVIHTDVDEIVFPDPRRYSSLAAFCASNKSKVITAHGFEICQVPDMEPRIDVDRPILQQRSWVKFSAAMCKPVMVRKPVTWAPGFHCTQDPITLGELYLFHLRWFDLDIALRRLARTRAQSWADPDAGSWQRWPDSRYKTIFRDHNGFVRRDDCEFLPDHEPLRTLITEFLVSQIGRENNTYKTELHIPAPYLLRIPDEFRDVF